MRHILPVFLVFIVLLTGHAKEVKDTVRTGQDDKIILSYNVSRTGGQVEIEVLSSPRVIPSPSLMKACGGEVDRLKVVVFDRIGDYGKVKWKGMTPSAFMVPSGLSHDPSSEGYFIFGECQPIVFQGTLSDDIEIRLPLYVAVYEKKQNYKIVAAGRVPLSVELKGTVSQSDVMGTGLSKERILVYTETPDEENEDITLALSSISLISTLLESETEYPFSSTLQAEINNLSLLKSRVRDAAVIERINQALLRCDTKEKELKGLQKDAARAEQAAEQARLEQQLAQQQEMSRAEEEKRQKKTIWMIIGSAVVAVLGFIGNAVFKNIRDKRNQKSLMDMQQSLVRQAEHEATRRSREVVRNGMRQASNQGKNKLRKALSNAGENNKKNKIRSI